MAVPTDIEILIAARAPVPPRESEPVRTLGASAESVAAAAIVVDQVIADLQTTFTPGDSYVMDLAIDELVDVLSSLGRISGKLRAAADRSRGR